MNTRSFAVIAILLTGCAPASPAVQQAEEYIRKIEQAEREMTPEQRYFNDISEDLSRHFGPRVRIQRKGKKGRLEIDFFNDEDLDRLLSILRGS